MKSHPSCYNGAILEKFIVFLKSVQFLHCQLGCSKEEEGLRRVGSFAKAGWKLWSSGNELWLANCYWPREDHSRPPQDILQAYQGVVEAFSPLAGKEQGRRMSWVHGKLRLSGVEAVVFGNRLLAKGITVRLTKVTFIHRTKEKYLCLELYSS